MCPSADASTNLSASHINRCSAMTSFPYGRLIRNVSISGADIDIFSNGACNHISAEVSVDNKGSYLGLKYQCVEFVRRYIFTKHQINLADRWRAKDAAEWYSNKQAMGLENVEPENSQAGDIITFTGGSYGHLAIISSVQKDGLMLCGQNFFNDRRDAGLFLDFNTLINKKGVSGSVAAEYRFQSVLRIERE